jgi:hypothetical protein
MTLTWIFVRGDERVEVRRDVDPVSTSLEVSSPAGDRSLQFRDHNSMVAFQASFEQALIVLGFHLDGFDPERRSGVDRRAVPRDNDRRGALALVWSR